MTGVGVSWSAPVWVGLSDRDYSELIQRKAVAVTKRDKRRGGQYTVKQAIEAIDEAFHRCNGFDPYDGSKLDPELLGTYSNERSKESGAAYKREMAMLPTVDHVTAEPVPDFEIVSWQTNEAKGDMPPEEFIAYCRRVVRVADQRNQTFRSENIYLSAVEERCLGKLKARSSGFVTRFALDESGVCEGRPAGQREMRQMAQCLRELGFVQERNATKDPLVGRTRKWHWPGTGDTGAAR